MRCTSSLSDPHNTPHCYYPHSTDEGAGKELWLSRFAAEAGPQGQGGKWGWLGGAGREEGKPAASEGAQSQFSVVEFRVVGAGFGVSLPGNGWIPAGGVGAEAGLPQLESLPYPCFRLGSKRWFLHL